MSKAKIIYTITDEAPALATFSFLPIVEAFTRNANIIVETRDISLAGRIIAKFPENLTEQQKQKDSLKELGELAKSPDANIVKLPNISASVPQLLSAINELKSHGYDIPDYPEEPNNESEKKIHSQFKKVLGSAVNPVLREGNSDRRVAKAVKKFAQQNPHSIGEWSKSSKSHVVHMEDGDFYSTEKSTEIKNSRKLCITLHSDNGSKTILGKDILVEESEIIDAACMSKTSLCEFFEKEINAAKEEDILMSLHLKATMMKISDPIIFGHAVKVFYKDAFEKHTSILEKLGVDENNGLGDVYSKITQLPSIEQAQIKTDFDAVYKTRPKLAMVDSDQGITNLHIPSNVIIDASMPALIRSSGKMWGPDGQLADTKAIIPDGSYAGIYNEVINFCREHGAFDVQTMGNVSNVGLMAKKAEEYGSHDKTFEIKSAGKVCVTDESNNLIFEHKVGLGDIWRMCQTKDLPIRDWVKLAVNRARQTETPAIFWLDENRAHDRSLIKKVKLYLEDHNTKGLDIRILSPVKAMRLTLNRVSNGEDTISVTGNVLRDYLTDLFPILELGTSAKMLSIVPLLAGGGLYETGAGGSAPKHVQQFLNEGHLRWDSLGEFLALAVSIEDISEKTDNLSAKTLSDALNEANSRYLAENKSPSRKVNELDNRGSHFYLAMFWAEALANNNENPSLADKFKKIAKLLADNEEVINQEMLDAQGSPIDIGGYYQPDKLITSSVMRPSATFNAIIDSL
mgnify:CR=1 FL=1|tara:strand:+ start:1731 stop:3953 length:2223 start_codon:yes stop_codon:yes gene_type:complete